ncbi:MAG: hypothetical protein QNJ00_14040 [Woeseiaceae bacterium]|nr:hypothetical protein [Woeseiaceae bacterium]
MGSFYNELRRRNVFKVAAGYALVAWILIEAGSVLLPTFGVPDWFFKVYVIMVFGGFLVAMIIAWVFEITPEGVKLESEIDRTEYTPAKSSVVNVALIGLLATALVISVTLNITGLRNPGAPLSTPVERTSVAVLPFENRSTDPENGFLADGIHDDLMDRLSTLGSLHVISGTSVNAYRDRSKSLSQIGEELDVSTIVEGSVQRAGNEIRVIVRVFDAATEERLWSDTYDRDASLKSVFDLQSEISAQIVAALPVGEHSRADIQRSVPTQEPQAFAAYVAGVNDLRRREFSSLVRARASFERAIELDPEYAQAHAKLAETVLVLHTNFKALSPEEALSVAGKASDRALELNPELADGYATRGLGISTQWLRQRVGDGNVRAAADFEKALSLNPSLSTAYLWFSTLRDNEDRVDDAIELLRMTMDVDPQNRIPFVNLPGLLALQGQYQEAIALLLYARELFPNWTVPNDYLARHLQGLGRIDESLAWSMLLREVSDDPLAGSSALGLYQLLGLEAEIDVFVEALPPEHPVYPVGASFLQFIRGDYEGTARMLEALIGTEYSSIGFFYPLLTRALLLDGQYERARSFLLEDTPMLASDQVLQVDRINAGDAVLLAFLEQQLGNRARARELLEAALEVTQSMPRIGFSGYGLRDVQIYTLLGRRQDALDALDEAVDAGVVSNIFFDFWEIDDDPLLKMLADEPAFVASRGRMRAKLESMKANIDAAIESGNWAPLREKAIIEASNLVSDSR